MEPSGFVPSNLSPTSSVGLAYASPSRHSIDQLALNMGFGGIKPSYVHLTNLSTSSTSHAATLLNSAPMVPPMSMPSSNSQARLDHQDDVSLPREAPADIDGEFQERLITKVDPVEMLAKPVVVAVPKDPARRAAMMLAGPKFRINSREIPQERLTIDADTIYPVAVRDQRRNELDSLHSTSLLRSWSVLCLSS